MPLIVLFILIFGTTISFATPINPAPQTGKMSIYEAINKAGYQCMLTQRIAKSYMAVVCDVDNEKYVEHLKGSVRIFENNLEELDYSSPNEAVRTQVRHVETLWQNYKFIYKNIYNEENALTVLKFNNELLNACNDVVLLLEDQVIASALDKDDKLEKGDHDLASIINVSGKQRMLTQRILLFSLANSYSIGNKTLQVEYLKESISAFESLFRELMDYSKNTDQIDNELVASSKAWLKMKKQLNLILSSENNTAELKEQLTEMMQLGEQILFSFDEVVFLYERAQ